MAGDRESSDGDDVDDAFLRLRKAPPEATNWSRRYKQNAELLRSGAIANVALVVERLQKRAHDKGLSSGEQRMLDRARSILACEALLDLPDGWEGDQPEDGAAGVREPRRPQPSGGAGPEALAPPQPPEDRTTHLDWR